MLRTILATIGGFTALAAVSAAVAMPLPAAPSSPAASLVEQVHGCHRGILRDRSGALNYGWHYHNRACGRVDVPPPGYSNSKIYDYSDRSWATWRAPVCRYRCDFHGPVKHCEQHCR